MTPFHALADKFLNDTATICREIRPEKIGEFLEEFNAFAASMEKFLPIFELLKNMATAGDYIHEVDDEGHCIVVPKEDRCGDLPNYPLMPNSRFSVEVQGHPEIVATNVDHNAVLVFVNSLSKGDMFRVKHLGYLQTDGSVVK